MKREKLDVWRGWINERVCEECENRIPRSKSRFRCSECETNLCKDCASLRGSAFPESDGEESTDMPARSSYPLHGQPGDFSKVQASFISQNTSQHNIENVYYVPPPPQAYSQAQDIFSSQSLSRQSSCAGVSLVSSRLDLRKTSSLQSLALQQPAKSAFRKRSLKGTSIQVKVATTVEWIFLDENELLEEVTRFTIQVEVATTVEWIFLDENELLKEVTRFSVPARGDMQRARLRTPDQIHVSWCPCGASCTEHGGRNWCGHRGCPYSIFIPPQPTLVISSQPFVRFDSPRIAPMVQAQREGCESLRISQLVQNQRQSQSLLGIVPRITQAPMQATIPVGYMHDNPSNIGAKVWWHVITSKTNL
eukprot:CAMPEP_0169199656 /NCGR_PEP_ID=MMETSP1016-20121227/9453_1 /TAXON_ID=342587 /ORGANISM="Karlodinium micrum, Strain CCMP2283" /LENGTH=363 /DNA_ID=CAMNT_0009276455 /DNA_START=94 /DNA_END=1186 /DNA_ORIENTATION=+